jgi:hypothetical protein
LLRQFLGRTPSQPSIRTTHENRVQPDRRHTTDLFHSIPSTFFDDESTRSTSELELLNSLGSLDFDAEYVSSFRVVLDLLGLFRSVAGGGGDEELVHVFACKGRQVRGDELGLLADNSRGRSRQVGLTTKDWAGDVQSGREADLELHRSIGKILEHL